MYYREKKANAMSRERKVGYERLEQTKRAFRRDGYNRGIRAAAKRLRELGYLGALDHCLKLLKPQLENPNVTVKR